MLKKNVVNGMTFIEDNKFCTGCALSKTTRDSFKLSTSQRSRKLGELIYMDLCSSSPSVSINDSRYFLLFKDDYSKYTHVFFLNKKSQCAFYIREYVARVKNEIGHCPKVIRTDNAKEFTSNEVREFLNKEGILLETIAPRAPQQIGSIERQNRTIIEDSSSNVTSM